MKVTLKSFNHSPSLSQETYAFTANVFIDGKNVGTARNMGHGGPTELSISSADRTRLTAHAKSIFPAVPFSFDPSKLWVRDTAEDVIDDLVHELVKAKEEARLERRFMKDLTTKLLVLQPNGTIQASVVLPTIRLAELLRSQRLPTWAMKGKVLNALPVAEARTIWFKAVVR